MRANLWYEWRVWSWELEATLSSILRRKNEIMSVCRCKQFVIGIAINWGNHTWCFYIFLQNKLITESEKKVRKVRNLRCNRVVLSYLQTVVNLNTGGKWRLKAVICRAFWVRSYQLPCYYLYCLANSKLRGRNWMVGLSVFNQDRWRGSHINESSKLGNREICWKYVMRNFALTLSFSHGLYCLKEKS